MLAKIICLFLFSLSSFSFNPLSSYNDQNYEKYLKLFIKQKKFDFALSLAASQNDLETVENLLIASENANSNRGYSYNTPLHSAAIRGNLTLAKMLLDYGANVNAKNKNGDTPLHIACSNGHLKMVQFLIQNDADIYQVNNKGETPLDVAQKKEQYVIELFFLNN